jgi:hypothetical protein
MLSSIATLIARTAPLVCLATWVIVTPPGVQGAEPSGATSKQGAAAGTPVAGTPVWATPVPSRAPRSRSDCERYIAALAGRGDRKLLDDAAVQDLAGKVPALVTCGAVASKSDALCAPLGDVDAALCRKRWSMIEDLRSNPKGRAFIFSERDYQSCVKDERMAPFCDGLRAAAASGDPGKCPPGKFQSVCKAVVSLDKSMCEQATTHPEGSGELRDWCIKAVEMNTAFSKGLDELAKSGPPLERNLARAALGQGDACAAYEAEAMKSCVR